MLIPFKKEHLEIMDVREHEKNLLTLSTEIGAILESSTVARTGIIDGRIIACGGVSKTLYGSGEVWLIPSIHVNKHRVTFLRFIGDWLEDVRKVYELHRLQTACPDDALHNNYMEFLGFAKEGKMKQYALGKDYCMWGLTWE